MEIETNAILLTAISKPYSVAGNEGVSHRVRLMISGEIYPCKSNESQVKQLSAHQGKSGIAVIKVNSPKENVSLELVSFKAD